MEAEGSLPCSQESANCSYPEPDESSPHLPTVRSVVILSSYLRIGPPSVSSLQVFRPKLSIHFSCLPCVLLVPTSRTVPSPYTCRLRLFN